jgi:hypothetical protein
MVDGDLLTQDGRKDEVTAGYQRAALMWESEKVNKA